MPLKIVTWNINGIRAVREKSTKVLLDSLKADIICLQETKVTRDMLDEPVAIVDGYDSYFSFSRKRTGYSGTATYCNARVSPQKAEEGLTGRLSTSHECIIKCYGNTFDYTSADLESLDAEGRCIITQHQIRLPTNEVKDVALLNVYVPRAGDKEDRLWYKLKFLTLLQSRAEELLKQNIHVIILGDLNLAHRDLDNCDPECNSDCNVRTSRVWMNKFLQVLERDPSLPENDDSLTKVALPDLKGGMFSDVYRQLHVDQENAFTNWTSSTDARKTNYGRRLDYILIDTGLSPYVCSSEIMIDVEGSDHCPVIVTLNCDPVPSTVCPSLCSKYMPEFKGQQQKLSSFFPKSVRQNTNQSTSVYIPFSDGNKNVPDVKRSQAVGSVSHSSSFPLSQSELKKSAVRQTSKLHGKRSAAANVKHSKKLKMQPDEMISKQSSLMFFFRKADSGQTKFPGNNSCGEVSRNCELRPTCNVTGIGAGYELAPTNSSASESVCTLSCSDSEESIHHSQESNSLLESQSICQSDLYLLEESNKFHFKASNGESSKSTTTALTDLRTNSAQCVDSGQAWKSLLSGPPPPPLCPGHKEPCILKTVNKKGPNKNKQFYVCARPEGAKGNPEYRCNYFVWYKHKK
ncbi:unnamed protein product [Candidula unifasciata]|uniref:DNA-(apurinic or apyrimidinic site) endonuclease n=1 Tax=Candidula unifasciata TaxID=100452 RepID=A0A8S3YXG7_9EUPU|nr:unnamed protein product [Candidula unifasciata]